MEGYEVPERLQEERQSLEKAIPALQKALRAAKVGDPAEACPFFVRRDNLGGSCSR